MDLGEKQWHGGVAMYLVSIPVFCVPFCFCFPVFGCLLHATKGGNKKKYNFEIQILIKVKWLSYDLKNEWS